MNRKIDKILKKYEKSTKNVKVRVVATTPRYMKLEVLEDGVLVEKFKISDSPSELYEAYVHYESTSKSSGWEFALIGKAPIADPFSWIAFKEGEVGFSLSKSV